MTEIDAELREAVEAFVLQLKNIFQHSALEKVKSALGDDSTPRKPSRRRGRPRGGAVRSAKKRGKRSPEQLEALVKNLLSYVRKNPGQRIEQVGAGLGISTKELVLPAKKLISEKLIRTKGQRRATTYFPK